MTHEQLGQPQIHTHKHALNQLNINFCIVHEMEHLQFHRSDRTRLSDCACTILRPILNFRPAS